MRIKRQSRFSGFTLVEILIVLAIISLLAATLSAVFARVREKGRQATCQSNLRQAHKALAMYVQDNDSSLPNPASFYDALGAYARSPDVFICPSIPPSPLTPGRLEHTSYMQPGPPVLGNKYGVHGGFVSLMTMVLTEQPGRWRVQGVHEALLENASKILTMGDAPYEGLSQLAFMPREDACGLTLANGAPDRKADASTIHNGGGNYLFYDGHVKWMAPTHYVQALCEAAPFLQPPFRAGGPHVPSSSELP